MDAATAVPLLVVSVGALAAPIFARRCHLPTAVGEILFGVAVGRGGLALLGHSEFVGGLAEIGFLFLMFLAGLEIDFDELEENPRLLRRGLAASLALLAVATYGATFLGFRPFFAVLLSAVSIGILVPTLRETGLLRIPYGQALLALGTIGEVATLVTLTAYEAWAIHGFTYRLAVGLGRILCVVAGALLALRLLAWAERRSPRLFDPKDDPEDPLELGVRGALVFLFVFVALAALLRVEAIVGAFLAGAVLRYVFRKVTAIEGKVIGAGFGFFIPVFFIEVGSRFDAGDLFEPGIFLPALLLSLLLVAVRLVYVPFLLRHGSRRALAGAMLLGAPLTLLVAISEVARRTGRIGAEEEASVVLAAILTSLVLPPAFRLSVGLRRAPRAAER